MFLQKVSEAFLEAGVEFALAGGHALAFHGTPRGTFDFDFVLVRELDNYQKAFDVLSILGLRSSISVTPSEIFQDLDTYITERNLLAWNFVNPSNPTQCVDLLLYRDLKEFEFEMSTEYGFSIPVLTVDSLIKMKRESGRKQDLEDVSNLEAIRKKA